MSQENVEMVRGLWEQFKGVDFTAIDWDDEAIREMIERFYSPEVELRWSTTSPEARVYRGREGVIQAFREWVEPFSEYYVEPLDFIEVGDRVVVPNRQWGIGSASGIPVEGEFTWSLKSGITRSRGSMSTTLSTKPSKPPGCRSRRCRRKTWRSCVGDLKRGRPATRPGFSPCLTRTWLPADSRRCRTPGPGAAPKDCSTWLPSGWRHSPSSR